MNTVIVHPKTIEEWEALKAIMKVLKIQFEELTTKKSISADWWDEISEIDKSEIEQSILESENNSTIPHSEINAKIELMINAKR